MVVAGNAASASNGGEGASEASNVTPQTLDQLVCDKLECKAAIGNDTKNGSSNNDENNEQQQWHDDTNLVANVKKTQGK